MRPLAVHGEPIEQQAWPAPPQETSQLPVDGSQVYPGGHTAGQVPPHPSLPPHFPAQAGAQQAQGLPLGTSPGQQLVCWQDAPVIAQTMQLLVPESQTSPAEQLPMHLPPHPSASPQWAVLAQLGGQPHTFAAPAPPHVWGAVQLPQLSVPPQPLAAEPQSLPSAAQVAGVQPHTFAMPPPPQFWGAVQVPQLRVAPHASATVPQFLPSAAQLVGTQQVCVLGLHSVPELHGVDP